MLTKSDFQQAIRDLLPSYPALAVLYEAGDPRILMHLEAVATMLGMVSSQVEASIAEPFIKSKGATILADAAMRGIVPKATPARVRISVTNRGSASYTLNSGRILIDSSGLTYRVETAATVSAGATGSVEAVQLRTSTITHTVAGSVPFYAIEIPEADDDAHLCSVAVSDASGSFTFRDRYVNTTIGERVFHVEADDRQRIYVRFGFAGRVGYQPADGEVITLTVSYSAGAGAAPAFGSPFSFDYIAAPAEAAVALSMDALLLAGENPISTSVLADLARYPSVYESSAVYLGEFDFLVRRNHPTLQFLSVWNEVTEEAARGASVDNINTLFVACLSAGGGEATVTEADPGSPIPPIVIADNALTATQSAIRTTILTADDSYRVRFLTPVRSAIGITISARVPTAYVASDVRAQIREAILAQYGQAAAASRRGFHRPLYQAVYALLKAKIVALSAGSADLQVSIEDVPTMAYRPELWRYVSEDSLTVTVDTVNTIPGAWGA